MKFAALCYHYVRSAEAQRTFPRIWGNTEAQFREHLAALESAYRFISLEDVRAEYEKPGSATGDWTGLLITFDDGLADHYLAARILAERGVRGVFFVPTCILRDSLPANPQIIHFTLAHYGVKTFLSAYCDALDETGVAHNSRYAISEGEEATDTIVNIKRALKYVVPANLGRDVLLSIYKRLLLKDFPSILEQMHLTQDQLREMIAMGHSVGAHTHTHISVAASHMDAAQFEKEIVEPRRWLAETFNTTVDSLSYPFGGKQDCLDAKDLLSQTSDYRFAFTVEHMLNTRASDPYALGRYEPWPSDDASTLQDKIAKMHV